jgi:hypothetical protein
LGSFSRRITHFGKSTIYGLYLKSQTHPDKYTHGHVQQKKPGCWYFHDSGVDITFGDEHSFDGILYLLISLILKGL